MTQTRLGFCNTHGRDTTGAVVIVGASGTPAQSVGVGFALAPARALCMGVGEPHTITPEQRSAQYALPFTLSADDALLIPEVSAEELSALFTQTPARTLITVSPFLLGGIGQWRPQEGMMRFSALGEWKLRGRAFNPLIGIERAAALPEGMRLITPADEGTLWTPRGSDTLLLIYGGLWWNLSLAGEGVSIAPVHVTIGAPLVGVGKLAIAPTQAPAPARAQAQE